MSRKPIDDGYLPDLVKGARFTGLFDMPQLFDQRPCIPKRLIPFEKRKKAKDKRCVIHFYMDDKAFKRFVTKPWEYIEDLSQFEGIISPDCSLYRDMPIALQLMNTYRARSISFYLQSMGLVVIPNVRWGSKDSYRFCFDGIPKHSMVAVSTHGCFKSSEDKKAFVDGFEKMVAVLEPSCVLIHGPNPACLEEKYSKQFRIVSFRSHIEEVHRGGR